jgi:Acyl-CoA dehydrogenase, N-terminal domain./Acyl-CoA dehydrogenase N terminal.
MNHRQTLEFLLYDWLQAEALSARPRFAEHTRATFDAVLDTCERIAREKYAPFNRLVDTEEPRFDGEKVLLPQATHEAYRAYAGSGMLSAAQDYDIGGMQLPYTVEAAANSFFALASISINPALLTVGNANLLMAHGSALQQKGVCAERIQRALCGHHVPERAAGGLVAQRHRHARRARRARRAG